MTVSYTHLDVYKRQDQLHADRQALGIRTAGNADTGQSRQVDGDGVDVSQIHRDVIRQTAAQLRCGSGCHRS